jgi:hypothetical protein
MDRSRVFFDVDPQRAGRLDCCRERGLDPSFLESVRPTGVPNLSLRLVFVKDHKKDSNHYRSNSNPHLPAERISLCPRNFLQTVSPLVFCWEIVKEICNGRRLGLIACRYRRRSSPRDFMEIKVSSVHEDAE